MMELEIVPKHVFMTQLERAEPKHRNSSAMKCFMKCPRKYFYEFVVQMKPRVEPPYFAFGAAYHKFREVLERSYIEAREKGAEKEEATVVGFNNAAKAGHESFRKRYPSDPTPGTRWDYLTAGRLAESMLYAWKWWVNEKKQGALDVIAIEQPFNVQLADGTFTSGRFDNVVRWRGNLWGRDFKTTSQNLDYYDRGIEPNDQFTRYTFAESALSGETVRGQIVEVLFNAKHTKSKKHGPEMRQYLATRNQNQIDTWHSEMVNHWNRTLDMARTNDLWPMNPESCHFCAYHSVCRMPNEKAQEHKLKQEFTFQVWDNAADTE